MEFLFDAQPQQSAGAVSQVADALRARVELVSRRDFPKLWKVTDKLNERNARNKPRSRTWKTIRSILCLLLGVFLFVPGVMKPGELTGPLVVGGLSILVGLVGLLPKPKKKEDPYLAAAEQLLRDRANLPPHTCQVRFDDQTMTITAAEADQRVPYDRFECVVEAADLYLLVYEDRSMVLWKTELSQGEAAGFLPALRQKGVASKCI